MSAISTPAAELTPTMRQAVDHARQHGGILERFPGGYWSEPGRTQWNLGGAVTFGTSTIAGLVARGVAEYTEWKEGRSGNFPVKVRLKEQLTDAAASGAGGESR